MRENFYLQSLYPFTDAAIVSDITLLENPTIDRIFYDPFKMRQSVAIICAEGSMKIKVNVREYEIMAPGLFTIVSSQIVQYQNVSEDLQAYFVIMSDNYTDKLFSDLREQYPLKYSVLNNPFIPLSESELKSMVDHFQLMRETLSMKDNPFRTEIIKHQLLTFFYTTTYQYHKTEKGIQKTKSDMLLESFLNLVQQHFKENREVEYYAAKLFITAKYLSKVLKERTGKTASEWISEHVIMEAKALLKSTNLNIQQISDELNFPSQSFFGKYFKQYVTMSPKDYRLTSSNE